MLRVGELPRHRGAQDQFGSADLDGVAEALHRLAVAQVVGDQVPDGLAVGLHEQPHHLLALLRRQRLAILLLETFAGILEGVDDGDAGGVVDGVVQRPDGHVRHADVEHAVGALPADELGQVRRRAGAQRLVAGVARLAADDGVLQVDDAEKEVLIPQPGPDLRVRRQAEIQAVRTLHVAAHGGDHVLVQPFFHRATGNDGLLIGVPHHRILGGGRHLQALHHGVAAGILAEQLVPDVETRRNVPDTLQQRQQAIGLWHEAHEAHRGAQAENRVVVVDQGDLAVAHVDVARHLHEGRLRRGYHAERLAHRVPVPGHHLEEQVGGARLVALQDGVGQGLKVGVPANLVAGQ